MPVKIGLTEDGQATPALQKKLAAKGLENIDLATLERESDGKQDYLVARGTAPALATTGLQEGIAAAIDGLPIPKVMRYQLADGVTTVKFVRPAHGLIALHGADVVPVTALGLAAGRETLGHRFMSNGPVAIPTPTPMPPRWPTRAASWPRSRAAAPISSASCWTTPAACPPRWATIRKSPRCWTKSPRWSSIPPSTWASSRNNSCKCRRNA